MNYVPAGQDELVVYVVDEDESTRAQLGAIVARSGLEVRALSSGEGFLREFAPESLGCLVVCTRHGSRAGLDLLEELRARELRIPSVVVAHDSGVDTVLNAMRAGASDVVEPVNASERLLPSVLRAIGTRLRQRLQEMEYDQLRARLARLTPREREVLQLVVAGNSTHEIAARLGIRQKTIEVYRSHINRKMLTRNATELANLMQAITQKRGPN